MPYRAPTQVRARRAQEAFLNALEALLKRQSYAKTAVEDIAEMAGLTKAAFFARFGSKKVALLLLFERYCSAASDAMSKLAKRVEFMPSAATAVEEFSRTLESLQTEHFASNRAMHELFLEDLAVDERTQKIFRELVDLMRLVQKHHLDGHSCSDTGAFSAAQMLVTTNYNYVLKAMPALPREAEVRHTLIANMVTEALKF